jgi:hypothetical protein
MMSPCQAAIDCYLERRLRDWHGLPVDCLLTDLLSRYPFNDGEGEAELGELPVSYRFRTLSHPAFDHPVFFYAEQDRLSCISSEFWSLDASVSAATLGALGEPDDRLDATFRGTSHARADRVYAGRGLALFVNPESGFIVRLMGFPPCSVESYRERYRPTGIVREFRVRGKG